MLSRTFRNSFNFYRNGLQLTSGYAKKSEPGNAVSTTASARPPRGYIGPSAYNLFYQNFLKTDQSTISKPITERMKTASQQWKALDEQAKKTYLNQSVAITEQKKTEFNNLPPSKQEELRAEGRKRRSELRSYRKKKERKEFYKATGRPKVPLTAYTRFVKEFLEKNPVKDKESAVEAIRGASEAWKNISASEKEKFVSAANEDMKVYKEKLGSWKSIHAQNDKAAKAAEREKAKQKKTAKVASNDIKKAMNKLKDSGESLRHLTKALRNLGVVSKKRVAKKDTTAKAAKSPKESPKKKT